MKQELIVKANALLQQPLYKTSTELKIFSMVLLEIRKNPNNEFFSLQIKEAIEYFDNSKENYTFLKNVAKKMFGVVDLNPSQKGFKLRVIFTEIETEEQGFLTFKLNPDMKPYILDLTKNFTQYYFENIARLKSSYSIRIYEFLKEYEYIGKRKTTIIELRHFLNIEENKYKSYKDFKRKTILVAQEELKEKTDIYFEFKEIKTVRKITDIEFFIYKNEKEITLEENKELSSNSKDIEKQGIFDKLVSLGVKEKQALSLIQSHTMERLNNNIRYVENEVKNGKEKSNLGGFVVSAIVGDFYNQTDLFKEDERIKKEKERREKEKKEVIKQERERQESLKNKEVKKKKIEKYLESLSDDKLKEINDNFISENKGNIILRKHLKNGVINLDNAVVKVNYYEFIYKILIK